MKLHMQSDNSFTLIDNSFIDKHMSSANGEFVKLYIYLLRCANAGADLSISSIADFFDHTEKDVKRALSYWEKLGILHLSYDAAGSITDIIFCSEEEPAKATPRVNTPEDEEVEIPSRSSLSTSRRKELKEDEEIRQLVFVAETYFGRPLSSSELNNIHKGIKVTISIPAGVELANKTFNPRLGIVGGISVLGTTGIVRPMSEDAIVQTIRAEISMRAALHYTVLPVVPGNYGMDFLTHEFGFDFGFAVESSNFSYDSILMAKEYGFKKYFLTGHLGKLVKIAGGAKNTHSKYGDGRMQTLCSASKEFCKEEDYFLLQKEIMACVSTENAVDVLIKFNLKEKVLNKIAELVKMNMQEWVPEVQVELVLFTKKHGVLAMTNKAFDFINELKACAARQEEK